MLRLLSGISRSLNQTFITILCLQISLLSTFIPSANADFISTSELVAQQKVLYDKEHLLTLLEQDEVLDKLIDMGVDISQAKQRVNLLTPFELSQLNEQIEELPAGSGIIGIIVLFTVIFIFTDVIGATDIFPFIKSVNK
jgi:hypothetical protein